MMLLASGRSLTARHPLAFAIVAALALPVAVQAAPVDGAQSAPAQQADQARDLDKVVVTGNRRQQELKDFAGSVTPISARELDRMGADSMSEYMVRSPGVNLTQMQPGVSNVTIRNVGSTLFIDQGQASTGIFLNDVPLTEPNFNFATPDLDTFDLERVEVLRGPQGTAFGSGTLGGAVNLIANRPRMGTAEGRLQLGLGRTYNATGLNNEIKGMINVPLGERAAMRLVLTSRGQAGYLDNIGTHRAGSNDSGVLGARLMLDWQLSDNAMLSWMSIYQQTFNADAFGISSALGRYQLDTPTASQRKTDFQIHSLRYTHTFDPATLTLSLTRKKKHTWFNFDLTRNPFVNGVLLGGQGRPRLFDEATIPGTTFEARLVSNGDGNAPFEWSLGFFHDRTEENIFEIIDAPNAAALVTAAHGAANGALVVDNQIMRIDANPIGTESALFGEATWRFADAWKLTLGGRYFRTNMDFTMAQSGFLYKFIGLGASNLVVGSQQESGFTPKVVLSYNINPTNMVYALASRGFRYGGPNPNPPGVVGKAPATYGSDSLRNYELGWRTSNANGSWIADITLFRIDWSDLQLRMFDPVSQLAYQGNVGDARINGLEASTSWRPSPQLDWSAALTLTDAKLASTIVSASGTAPAGTRLPGSAKVRFSTLLTYTWEGAHAPFATVGYRYQSKAPSDLFVQTPLLENGGFGVLDLRAGFRMGNATVTGYVSNVGNSYGIVAAGQGNAPNTADRLITLPRSYGVQVDWRF